MQIRSTLKVLLWSSALFTLASGLFSPLYSVFVEQIGGGLLTAGGAYGLYSIASGSLIFLFGL